GFMSGMAGNVSAFTTVWTYDIYRALINKGGSDHHYVNMGRWCTILGVLISVGTAYLVMQFASIMDYVQALFSFFVAPLFGTVVVSYMTQPKPVSELEGLVYGVTAIPQEAEVPIYHRPAFWAVVVGAVFVVLNILVW